jgi:hypothetical protein
VVNACGWNFFQAARWGSGIDAVNCVSHANAYQAKSSYIKTLNKVEHTFNALNLPSSEASKSPLMFGPTDSCRSDRTLDWSACRRTTFTGGCGVRHCGLGISSGGEKACYIAQVEYSQNTADTYCGVLYLVT